ncbi:MAG: acetate kinase [Acidobacteria bacterium]|jgi:acetate kinase|nr:MAG: acetate kinase [Acidobacteriota bacterium]
MKILVLNSGSSSQKACLYEIGSVLPGNPPACVWEAKIEFGERMASISVKNAQGAKQTEEIQSSSRREAVKRLLSTLADSKFRVLSSISEIAAVGHRIVHGGPHFEDPVLITREVREAIAAVAELAPLHTTAVLEGIEIVEEVFKDVPQIAVFDTGFHRQMPLESAIYPGPYEWFENNIRRYGFHGINHQYCAGRAAQLLKKDLQSLKIVSCHLGNGCSVTAVESGRSVDTTMGFTPLDGIMMGTRSGSVDPGILIHLMRRRQLDSQQIDRILNHESGLLGISGISSDMREMLKAVKQGNQRAKLAFDIYVHRLRAAIGSMAAAMGGMDALIFTAGIGENSPQVRAATCERLGFLGIELDQHANANPQLDADISTQQSRVRVWVIRAEEDWTIATECWKMVRAGLVGKS